MNPYRRLSVCPSVRRSTCMDFKTARRMLGEFLYARFYFFVVINNTAKNARTCDVRTTVATLVKYGINYEQ